MQIIKILAKSVLLDVLYWGYFLWAYYNFLAWILTGAKTWGPDKGLLYFIFLEPFHEKLFLSFFWEGVYSLTDLILILIPHAIFIILLFFSLKPPPGTRRVIFRSILVFLVFGLPIFLMVGISGV